MNMWKDPVHYRHKPNEWKLAVDGVLLEMDVSTAASHGERVWIDDQEDLFIRNWCEKNLKNILGS